MHNFDPDLDGLQLPDESYLLFDSNRGQYIPQNFAEEIDRGCVYHVTDEDWATLEAGPGPENEWYWEAWENVLNNALILDGSNVYVLEQDGDVWLAKAGVTFIAPAYWAPAMVNGDYSGIDDEQERQDVGYYHSNLDGPISDVLAGPTFMSPAGTDTPDQLAGDYCVYLVATE